MSLKIYVYYTSNLYLYKINSQHFTAANGIVIIEYVAHSRRAVLDEASTISVLLSDLYIPGMQMGCSCKRFVMSLKTDSRSPARLLSYTFSRTRMTRRNRASHGVTVRYHWASLQARLPHLSSHDMNKEHANIIEIKISFLARPPPALCGRRPASYAKPFLFVVPDFLSVTSTDCGKLIKGTSNGLFRYEGWNNLHKLNKTQHWGYFYPGLFTYMLTIA